MKRMPAFRLTADLCFFFSLLLMFPVFRGWWLPMAVFTGLAFLCLLAAVNLRSAVLRILLALIPGIGFLMIGPDLLLIFPALAWGYLICIFATGRFSIWLDVYRRIFIVMLILCLFVLFANFVNTVIGSGAVLSAASVGFALLFLFFGMTALRGMQMNAVMPLRWHLSNTAVIVGVPAAAVMLSFLLFYLLKGLLFFLDRVFTLILRFLFRLSPDLFDIPIRNTELTPPPTFPPDVPEFDYESSLYRIPNESRDPNNYVTDHSALIWTVVVCILILALAVFLILRYLKLSRTQGLAEETEYAEFELDRPVRTREKKTVLAQGKAQTIRRIYRKYLLFIQKNGVAVRLNSTSQDVLDAAERIRRSEPAVRLREIYLKARYGGDSLVSGDDVQAAQECLLEIMQEEARSI
ncbi:MAG: hypothetical protein K6G17_06200 [Oscillospiraceae bacterium]|nr:hypothetical protein [Oscillospiraceae bacterium]